MKAIIKMVNGEEFTVTGDLVSDLHDYFTGPTGAVEKIPIGWLSTPIDAINLKHAVSIKFESEASN
ncbi:hypothetical protein [Cytobacillus purgationiresistens]|uniref:Phage protein n=1 Tax=Cytobacillus purgationiresistens TaxID=863449 RepID=A0ABU0AIN1_9BACI|nr:hypothetical protein [Cytobacillus purgationiresistens]MDQ0270754.1 hypothetical protein [Cytobacillus purgationiresistens]